MKRTSLVFVAPRRVELVEETLPDPAPRQVLVETVVSAISSGTELLLYRGEAPQDLPADLTIKALDGGLAYPLKYGYAAVGRVADAGPAALVAGDLVFTFHPHESHFWADPADLQLLPPALATEDAVLLPHVETAVNFLHDGAPLIGEQVVVIGQGVMGLLATMLLARLPLGRLLTLDRFPTRREFSERLGAHASFDPGDPASTALAAALLGDAGADLVYELSGQPAALDQAIDLAGFGSRVIIGSWYGSRRASVDLGGRFHRSRISLISSQVSTLEPALTGRWTKERRLGVAWRLLADLRPSQLITHRLPFGDAATAYRLLDEQPNKAIQAILTYH